MHAALFTHVPASPFGSASGVFGSVQRALEARGHTMTIVAPSDLPELTGVDPKWYPFRLPWAVRRRLRTDRSIDVAVFHSYAGWAFHLFPGARPHATVTEFHGLEPLFYDEHRREKQAHGGDLSARYRWLYGRVMPRLLRMSCRRSTRVVCLNRAEEQYLLAHRWCAPDALRRSPLGAPDPRFRCPERAYAPIAGRPVRLLTVSQWLDTKGTRYLIDALARLIAAGRDVTLVCAGTRQPDGVVLGDFPAALRSRVRNIADITSDALAGEYCRADIFIHASVSEGASRAQLEAMAAGLPMVTTPTAPAVDLLTDDESVRFVPKRQAAALATAIAALIDDADARARLGRGAARVAASLPPNGHAEFMADLIVNVATLGR